MRFPPITRSALSLIAAFCLASAARAELLAGFTRNPYFDEQVREQRLDDARALITAPANLDPHRPTLIIFYALPNGNTIEQTIGCRMRDGLDWHFDIQHIGAQTGRLRELLPERNIVVIYLEADTKSWPAWRQKRPDDNAAKIRAMLDQLARQIPGEPVTIALAAHSGGGSLIFGYLNAGAAIEPRVERIALLDANYGYDDAADHHGDKLLAWLHGDLSRRLVVIAYDDRNVMLNGKNIVSDTGGTYRATHRMLDRFANDSPLESSTLDGFDTWSAAAGQARFFIHRNPDLKILHTALVGEMNGFLEAMTLGTPAENTWGTFGGERAYTKWIQPEPTTLPSSTTAPVATPTTRTFHLATQPSRALAIPPRPRDAVGGQAFMERLALLAPADREQEIPYELSHGNVPEFLRQFKTIHARWRDPQGNEHTAEYEVAPDYLAAGRDEDWVPVPMTPLAARYIADAFGCSLPTQKIVNDIYLAAEVKLEPQPLTERREAIGTFVQHHELIESQRTTAGKPLGALIAGIKKDIVLTNRLNEKPQRVAIYGWHKLDGQPIQPLTIVHKESYVDYSHGVRLVKRQMLVDGKPMDYEDVLRDPSLCGLVSDEGPIDVRDLYR